MISSIQSLSFLTLRKPSNLAGRKAIYLVLAEETLGLQAVTYDIYAYGYRLPGAARGDPGVMLMLGFGVEELGVHLEHLGLG